MSPWSMEIRRHDDIAVFCELAGPLLRLDPLRHTIILTVLAGASRAEPVTRAVTMLTVHGGAGGDGDGADADGGLCGAVLRTEGRGLLVSALPLDAVDAVAEVLAEHDPDLPGVAGPTEQVEAFAHAWTSRTGTTIRPDMALRLFVLEELLPPTGTPGAARVADTGDVDLLAAWHHDFYVEALPWVPENTHDAVLRQLHAGTGHLLWEVAGEPVATAASSPPVAGMSRISAVWTPVGHRGRGYGSAVTAAASRWAMDAGAEQVVLFTDVANPVSNSIYPRIGYRPLGDFAELGFERP